MYDAWPSSNSLVSEAVALRNSQMVVAIMLGVRVGIGTGTALGGPVTTRRQGVR